MKFKIRKKEVETIPERGLFKVKITRTEESTSYLTLCRDLESDDLLVIAKNIIQKVAKVEKVESTEVITDIMIKLAMDRIK